MPSDTQLLFGTWGTVAELGEAPACLVNPKKKESVSIWAL